ncbi:MAG TPA: Calx-beta domain-containing protein, partial [Pyrinomonadaceae bacterium]|nr:Calx-beta domain-containing protein [Pyrinomonadaceae bacterium]
ANDSGDGDTGPNNLQNFPVLTSAVSLGGNTTIQGTLNSTSNTQCSVDLYANNTSDASGNGEGQNFITSTTVTTNGSGDASFTLTVPSNTVGGQFITATATDPGGNTSEFSAWTTLQSQSGVQFSATSYSVVEDCTTVTITVNRLGDTSSAATVDYFTTDVTATERRDYVTAIGKLRFAPGESAKVFAVLINEDSYVEGNETFNISLSNPSGVGLGAPALANVQITDDLNEPTANVIDDPQNFVCQHYHDFLNRQPDAPGLAFWTGQITSCGNDQACIQLKRINVSAAFYLSIEFQDTGYLVERIYKTAYGNANGTSTFGGNHNLPVPIVRLNEFLPDTQQIGLGVVVGQQGWEQVLENNKQAFTTEFVTRSRFALAFPSSLTPAQFVDALNANAGNPLSQSERNQLVSELTSGAKTRAQVLRAVAQDSDLNNSEKNRAFVLMQYFGYLRRNPNDPQDTDYTGFDFWLTKLNEFNGNFVNAEMVKAFITSGEYRQRFAQ